VFRGVQHITMDAKGRMAMPTKHRDALNLPAAEHLIATIDTQVRCLLLYPLATWEKIEKDVQALPSMNPSARRFQRLFLGYATELELDANGRFLLPASLRDYAGLDKKVVMVGQGIKIEIWDEAQWLAECEQAIGDANAGAVPDELAQLVF
jgi:MraZ protein